MLTVQVPANKANGRRGPLESNLQSTRAKCVIRSKAVSTSHCMTEYVKQDSLKYKPQFKLNCFWFRTSLGFVG